MQAHKTPTAKPAENYKMKGRLIFIVGDAQEYAPAWMQGFKTAGIFAALHNYCRHQVQ